MVFCEGYLGVAGFANITWTDEHTLVLGFAQASELGRLYRWWQDLLGADRCEQDPCRATGESLHTEVRLEEALRVESLPQRR